MTILSADPRAATNGDGVSDEEAKLREEILQRDKTVTDHYKDWDEAAKEDYAFALGDQWTGDERTKLKDAGRPCLTFNRIRPLINVISGYQRENSARIKVNPEGGEDRTFSEVMDRTFKAVDKWSHLTHKMGYWFDDGCYCGKGWLEAIIKYDRDAVRGELDFKQRSPYQIKVDPECKEYDINESARYAFKYVRLPKSELKELYPDKAKLIDGFVKDNDDPVENGAGAEAQEGHTQDDDYSNRAARATQKVATGGGEQNTLPQDGKFLVKEYWRIKMVKRFFVINKDSGTPDRFDKKDLAEAFAKEQGNEFKVIERQVKEMHVAAMVCGYIMQNTLSTFEPYYSGFPFFRFLADWAPNAETEVLRTQGMTRPLKDPQREKNKSKSQNLHILNTQANSGWVGDEDALTDANWALLEQVGSKPGITIKKKRGSELREILPKGPNAGHIQREQAADQEFTQISNINPDLLGFQDGTQSGKAIGLRIKQAVIALIRLFSNYKYSKEILGKFILDMIPMLFDVKKLKRVLGEDFLKKAPDPEKYKDGLTDGVLEAFLHMVKDERYDVLVAEADQNSTIRYEIFQQLADLASKNLPIPIDLLVDYMDLPNAQEVKQKIKEQQQQMQAAEAAKTAGKQAP